MPKCPHCGKEIEYAARDQGIDEVGFRMPLFEISCSLCDKVISVVIEPSYYLESVKLLLKS